MMRRQSLRRRHRVSLSTAIERSAAKGTVRRHFVEDLLPRFCRSLLTIELKVKGQRRAALNFSFETNVKAVAWFRIVTQQPNWFASLPIARYVPELAVAFHLHSANG